jgi:hypothetical protein
VALKTLKVHGTVLIQRSAYFERALQGAFQEGRDKTITLTLDDAEALEDMELLIRLANQPTYGEGLRTLGVG